MNKAHTITSSGGVMLIAPILLFPLAINGLIETFRYALHGEWRAAAAPLLGFAVLSAIIVFFLIVINRMMCTVRLENGTIKRQGLCGGFYKELNIRDIQNVVFYLSYKEGMFIYLIDDSEHKFDRVRSDSYICFPKTEANLQFVRSFWDKEIAEKRTFDSF